MVDGQPEFVLREPADSAEPRIIVEQKPSAEMEVVVDSASAEVDFVAEGVEEEQLLSEGITKFGIEKSNGSLEIVLDLEDWLSTHEIELEASRDEAEREKATDLLIENHQ